MSASIKFSNPEGIHAPAGLYVHGVLVPPAARILLISGQVGIRPDGTFAKTAEEQADQIFQNIGKVLRANQMDYTDIVKLSTLMVFGQSATATQEARRRYMGDHRPSATFVFVPQLYSADWFLEIEAMAAKV